MASPLPPDDPVTSAVRPVSEVSAGREDRSSPFTEAPPTSLAITVSSTDERPRQTLRACGNNCGSEEVKAGPVRTGDAQREAGSGGKGCSGQLRHHLGGDQLQVIEVVQVEHLEVDPL